MNFRSTFSLSNFAICLVCLAYSSTALSGYKVFLDPRSMAMGGTGVASASKFNASAHNPALIAFNRGDKPDKIYLAINSGQRQLYGESFNSDVLDYQNSPIEQDFINAANSGDISDTRDTAKLLKDSLSEKSFSSYRSDEMHNFNLLVDTDPLTINFYTRREIRKVSTILNKDAATIDDIVRQVETTGLAESTGIEDLLSSSVESTQFDYEEMGATVATTNVIDYNMPISWGFTPKLIQFNASQVSRPLDEYDVNNAPADRPSDSNLEWNVDIGLAILFTDNFLREEFGLDGWWLEGEWVFGISGMNMFPTDISTFSPPVPTDELPRGKPSVQARYKVGLATYREDYMMTLDIDLNEDEVFAFEGNTRFISFGGEYYWRDDFHLRAGARFNIAETEEASKEDHTLTAGFLYQPRHFNIEAAFMLSEVEAGGSIGFGLAF
ncbi:MULTISPECIES: conjugal transfer protein TraF [unclassified Oleiphilus]|jgi:hypothetical protein|uniref:conjugal transfer protein TraF n=4 Tax=Oleiphilus TaxID=141450 RepID=UPI0007C30C57|nr:MULTISPECIES: conjugal transfer protein TraF [unclassified Oleiphilus]KZY34288.1 hypothetical protein A3729_05490 [Oleiphilus sp. HI0043]KZY60362.1 hypothetical protein A3735_12725 [Oleiphilus sp. HI0061]KZZ37062.1 hypothetical protein A3756_11380 [Oleiphilus sp. HI0086]KZZ64660.1 hypothetical protein A3763_05225 [Oleiphilus sp. HI0128]KZZ79809.1 hypothetical protein A3766_09940 [Oleiphilus sp. HI0132]